MIYVDLAGKACSERVSLNLTGGLTGCRPVTPERQQRAEGSAPVPVHGLAGSRRARVSHSVPQLPPQGESLQPPGRRTHHRSLQVRPFHLQWGGGSFETGK